MPFQYQGYFLDRFENVAHNLQLEMKQSANTRRSYSKGTCRPASGGGRMVKRDVKRARRGPCMQPSLFPKFGEGSVWRGRERSPGAVQGCIHSQATRLAWLPLVGTLPLYQVNREERLRLCRVTHSEMQADSQGPLLLNHDSHMPCLRCGPSEAL